jgi:hypothetical protein
MSKFQLLPIEIINLDFRFCFENLTGGRRISLIKGTDVAVSEMRRTDGNELVTSFCDVPNT